MKTVIEIHTSGRSRRFKIGDLVNLFPGKKRMGRVVQIHPSGSFAKVQWPEQDEYCTEWWDQKRLKLAENPIQRMKRLYSET